MTSSNDERRVWGRIGRAVADVAPTIAASVGGPLAGAATDALRRAVLGDTPADDAPTTSQIEEIILARDPAALAAIKQAEIAFRKAVLEADAAHLRISADDRASARDREIALKDATPTILGIAVISGFFGVLLVMLIRTLPPQAETEFSIMLGALATMTAAVVNYFFGSSADSREKTQIMAGRRPPRS